ncbi:uncharacterized protein F4817DRAFT_369125 [Daldinia loculata]|uniref:uncharacterized protein n=1 Tax=Daldinia loculata TaxID=103429 RepID=UPI0020C40E99|nr:uncharacterized protein F4817DRAFT_369125 [Daldinia loculata]KAI1642725.1 hypothetical protein F4817DRAFT_369125 [Daldinia loculata]
MAPRLQFDVWQCLRMGRMNKKLNSANPHRYRALQPIEYAFINVVTSNVRAPGGWSYTVDFGSVVREILDFDSMRQCLANPEGYRCFELLIDTAISTGTVPSLDLWGINSPSMLLGNSIKQNCYDAVAVILRRRTELGLDRFLSEMCFENIPVMDGFLSQYHLSERMIECLIACTGMPFSSACGLAFVGAINFLLKNSPELQNNPDQVLAGFHHLTTSPSWYGNPGESGRNITRCINALSRFIRAKTLAPVPIPVVEMLLNRIWRVVNPIARFDAGVGDAEGVTQEQLLDAMAQSITCQQYSRVFNTIIDLNPRYAYIPNRNADRTARLGHTRFVDLVTRENIGLPLNFNWNRYDRSTFDGGRIPDDDDDDN